MNDDNKKKLIILFVMIIVFGFVVWRFVLSGDSSETAAAGLNTPAQGASADRGPTRASGSADSVFLEANFNLEELIQSVKEVEFEYAQERQARDPMAPLTGTTSLAARKLDENFDMASENLLYEAYRKNVTGILYASAKPLAVIDNEVVGVGHNFTGNIIVKKIAEDHVVLVLSTEDGEHEVVRELKEQ